MLRKTKIKKKNNQNELTSRRSSIPSPTPINLTGRSSSLLTATTLPPRALPSSFVSIRPDRPTSLFHTRAESRAMRPCAASSTRRDSWGTSIFSTGLPSSSFSTESRFWMTRFIFVNSFVSASLLLNLPDVSTSNVSYFSLTALSNAPYKTAAGEASCSDGPYISTFALSAHCCSCSTAPARKVSQAAINTV